MDKKETLDEAAIEELLATANKELFVVESEAAPADNPVSQLPLADEKQLPQTVIGKKIDSISKFLRYALPRKVLLALVFLFCLCIAAGGYWGYQSGKPSSKAPLSFDQLLAQGITFEGKTFVFYAGRGDENVVSAFLDEGMEINTVRNTDGWTALTAAAFYNKTELVRFLLTKQANVNVQDLHGRTPLLYAAAMGNEEIVSLLLKAGANPNIQDQYGRTALIEAYSKQQASIAELLKSSGADPNPSPLPPPSPTIEKMKPPSAIPKENRLSAGCAGLIKIGMPLEEIKKIYPSLILNEEYVDGNKQAIAIIPDQNTTNPALKLEVSAGKSKQISTISVYDDTFSTEKKITTHSTVGEIRNEYPISAVRVIDNALFLQVKSIKMLFELDISSSDTSLSWIGNGDADSIPSSIKIKRIVLY